MDGLAWRETNSGGLGLPTVLFLHGLGGSRIAWEPQLEALGEKFHCIAWDCPGYGESESILPYTFAGLADEAVRLLDLLAVERAHIVGLSFGGQQALHFAIRHPGRIDRLVLADTSAVFGADGTDVESWKRLRLDSLDGGQTPADLAEPVIDAITAEDFDGFERDRAIAAFRRISSDGLRAAVECLPTHDVRNDLANISASTLVVLGEFDEETPISYSEYLADHIPGARLELIAGAGHLTPSEAPTLFSALVSDHLMSTG